MKQAFQSAKSPSRQPSKKVLERIEEEEINDHLPAPIAEKPEIKARR